MSEVLKLISVVCPYCGESIELLGDVSNGEQAYIEDCSICCRPIECRTRVVGVEMAIEVSRDDD
jgi:hypothetical protein